MLVLTRKLDESIVIGGDVRITLLSVRNGQVRLGIEAPASVPVVREELLPSGRKGRPPHRVSAAALRVPANVVG